MGGVAGVRGAARHDQHLIDGVEAAVSVGRSCRLFALPGLRQRVLDAGRSDNKEGRFQPGSHLLKAVTRGGQVISAQAVDHHRLPGRRHALNVFRKF